MAFKPVAFDPYGRRRSRVRVPRWLLLLLTGIVAGAGGVMLVQERYLPPRLSAGESAQLRASFEAADADRTRLTRELADATKQLQAAVEAKKSLSEEVAASRTGVETLRKQVASLVELLPPDPRNGDIAVRAARFSVERGALTYDVVLSRERTGGKPFTGVMQFVVAGEGPGPDTVALKPVAVSVGRHESLSGSLPLPDGFKPREATVNVLDRVDGKRYGMRVVYVTK